MRVAVSRASVAAGDDTESHDREFRFPLGSPLDEVIEAIAKSGWLPRISGGYATWSVASNFIVAVVAQEWVKPRMTPAATFDLQHLDWRDGVLHLHFNYHAQIDPDVAFRLFWGLQLRA